MTTSTPTDIDAGTNQDVEANIFAVEKRDYQERILNKAIAFIDGELANKPKKFTPDGSNYISVMIESPTGSGKTVMGLTIAKLLHERGYSIGWSAMRRNLLTQAEKENVKYGFNIPDISYISMFQETAPRCDVLISDEAHHEATRSMSSIHSMVKPKIVIMLSATSSRTDQAMLGYQYKISDAGISELIQDGYLSPYDLFIIESWEPKHVVERYLHDRATWGKSIMFFLNSDQCHTAAALLRKKGVACDVVTGGTDREAQLEALRSGKLEVLINMNILTEGMDMPGLQTVFIRDTYSIVFAKQTGGRVLRRFPGIETKNIVQSTQSNIMWDRIARPRRIKTWDKTLNQWLTTGSSDRVNAAIEKTMEVLRSINPEDGFASQILRNRQRLGKRTWGKEKKNAGDTNIDDE